MIRSLRDLRDVAVLALSLVALSVAEPVGAQRPRPPTGPLHPYTSVPGVAMPFDSSAFGALRWRELGPYRGGRSVAVTGNPSRPNEFWQGSPGGGVFKSVNAGESWAPVTDKYFGGTIGAIAVAPSSPDVVYVGGGEYPLRGNVSHGDGVWKTTDGGKTWMYMGLKETRQIGDIVVNPTNPELVYVGALGHVWAPNAERGVYRSKDGGRTWDKILFRNDSTGVVDLVMDPNNANVLYAAFWQAGRTPWLLSSGGKGSGLFKTTDGGDHWTEITRNPGLPEGIWGNIGITVSAANSNRLWANIEADSGGVFRSNDGGATWTRTNGDRSLRQRAWYYTKIHADPKDTNLVYVNNVSFMKSTDGGKTFRPVGGMRHGDSHDLWIDPKDPRRMIEADDGGGEVTVDGGKTWTDEDFATAQFYHVIATNHFPYHVCGAQQDNSTLCGPSRAPSGAIDISDWKEAGGGESGWIAARPDDPDVIYAGSYGNLLTRKDMRTEVARNVNPWPDNPMGHPAKDLKYRFQWTFPIITSVHDPNVIYAGSNAVHKSTNGGQSWTVISPDLTYADPATLGNSGGPITKDQTSVEYYAVVFVIEESPLDGQVLWTGSDDGKVFVTRDGGKSWQNVTPPDMQKYTRVSSIDASHFGAGIAYLAANRYQLDDDRPFLWKTQDFGKTWTRIDTGIDQTEFARVVREDPEKRGLLVAGTERGVWFSADDGQGWQKLQLNLPIVPVHDLIFKEGDIVLATHGRSFWVMDNIATLEQLSPAVLASTAHLFKPRDQYRANFGGGFGGGRRGGAAAQAITPENAPQHPIATNPQGGVLVQYFLKAGNLDVSLDFLDAQGKLIRTYTSKLDSAAYADSVRRQQRTQSRTDSLRRAGLAEDSITKLVRVATDAAGGIDPAGDDEFRAPPTPRAPNRAGVNTFNWNMRYPDASSFQGMILWAAGTQGPLAPPGTYSVRLTVGGKPIGTENFRLNPDPRSKGVTTADYTEQFALLTKIRDRFSETNDAVKKIRFVKREIEDRRKRISADRQASFATAATAIEQVLSQIEDSLYQTKNRSGQDPLNYPIRLNNKIGALMGVVGSADGRPTQQSYAVFTELSQELDRELAALKRTLDAGLPRLNGMLKDAGLPAIEAKPVDAPPPRQVAEE
ncbi:MAG: WD40/YVTN/BNR-like repeat-containing protein [Gemmatimonadaceae bacterium]